jgi:hypothetical protein
MAEYEEIKTTEFTLQESGLVMVRTTTRTFKDGVAFGAPVHHRCVIGPHDDLDNVPTAPTEAGPLPSEAQSAIRAWWTTERVGKFDAAVEAIQQLGDIPDEKKQSLLSSLTFGLLK